jgi:radical SAM superfamily enzyme YgiQ (UPF0313 family)
MKILLTTLNSKYIHSNLALRYLYQAAKQHNGHKQHSQPLDIEIREFTINNEEDYIFQEIIMNAYNVLCISCYIWNRTQVLQLVDTIKKVNHKIIIILGGPEVSYDSERIMGHHPGIDVIVRGEGEKTFSELLDYISRDTLLNTVDHPDSHADPMGRSSDGLEKIKGITYRKDNKIISNNSQDLECNLDSIPFPYDAKDEAIEDRILYYETSRGCPYGCSYCLSSVQRGVRYFSLERVKKDLLFFLEKKVRQVKFVDRTFNADNNRALEIMKFLHEKDNGITNFHFEVNGDIITDEMITLIRQVRSGLFQMEIGVQSTHEETISAIDRKMNFNKIAQNVELLKEAGKVHLHLDLIAGLPYESFERFKKSFNDVYALGPDDLQLGFLKLLKGSKIRSQIEEHGYSFREKEPYEVLSNHYISAIELIKLKRVEQVLDKYYNSSGFKNTIAYILDQYYESSYAFYEDLANYWVSKGFHHQSNSKEALYTLLADFCIDKGWSQEGPAEKKLLEELLLYDAMLTTKHSRRATPDKNLIKTVHELLHDEKVIRDMGYEKEEFKAKDFLKNISFYQFDYDIHSFAKDKNTSNLKNKCSNITLFDTTKENIRGEYKTTSIFQGGAKC